MLGHEAGNLLAELLANTKPLPRVARLIEFSLSPELVEVMPMSATIYSDGRITLSRVIDGETETFEVTHEPQEDGSYKVVRPVGSGAYMAYVRSLCKRSFRRLAYSGVEFEAVA